MAEKAAQGDGLSVFICNFLKICPKAL